MKIVRIVVDELPGNCLICVFERNNCCCIKSVYRGDGKPTVNRNSDNRNENCPLEVEDES